MELDYGRLSDLVVCGCKMSQVFFLVVPINDKVIDAGRSQLQRPKGYYISL